MLKFGFSAVVSGVRNIASNNEPNLVANSTKAKFTITGLVSRAMGLIPGDNVQFVNNLGSINNAILERDPDLVAFAEENGFDFDTKECADAIIREFGAWAIIKGIPMLEKDGSPRQVAIRQSEEQKKVLLEMQTEELLVSKRDTLVARAIAKGVITEDMAEEVGNEVLVKFLELNDVVGPTMDDYSGSKTSTTSNMVGLGLTLSFSDSNIWEQLKSDLEEPTKINRVFKVNLEEPINISIPNGREMVNVKAYSFEFEKDEEPVVRTAKK